MGVDLFQSRRTNYHKCKWWDVGVNVNDFSELKDKPKPSGIFYAKFQNAYTQTNNILGSVFQLDKDEVYITTNDNVDGLKNNCLVEYEFEIWRVVDLQTKPIHKQEEFSRKVSKTSYIRLRR